LSDINKIVDVHQNDHEGMWGIPIILSPIKNGDRMEAGLSL
jgi:hypothetical protein